MRISKEEFEIINVLKENEKISFEDLVEKCKLNKDLVERLLQNLKLKNLIEIEIEEKKVFSLSQEGKKYLEEGLPERKVLELISKGITNAGELSTKYKNAEIGIIWLKNNKLISIIRGEIQLSENAIEYLNKKMPKEIFLEELKFEKNEEDIKEEEKEILAEFIKRKIVEEKIIKKRFIKLTEFAKNQEFEVEEEITILTSEILKKGLWKNKKFKKYELVSAGRIYPGKIHFYNRILNEVKKFLISLGFQEFKGKIIECNFWNCDALFMPSRHVARDIHDIYYIDTDKEAEIDEEIFENVKESHLGKFSKGWEYFDEKLAKKYILRSHNTAISARVLYKISKKEVKIPLKMFAIDRVFRPDTIDAKHFVEFDQLEGIIVDKDLNFSNLLYILKELVKIFGSEEVKFKPAYFPFTEPSVEVFVKIGNKYIEVGGAGIFREEVTKPFNIDLPVLAWGIGIGRLVMLKTGINDIRDIMSQNIDILRNM
ncbi:MAG: phenylalanine--tRNA ligase subunit alpha [Candidatus Aenigmatarchaeota archaeon]